MQPLPHWKGSVALNQPVFSPVAFLRITYGMGLRVDAEKTSYKKKFPMEKKSVSSGIHPLPLSKQYQNTQVVHGQ